jgi:signal transduction histidine kinase
MNTVTSIKKAMRPVFLLLLSFSLNIGYSQSSCDSIQSSLQTAGKDSLTLKKYIKFIDTTHCDDFAAIEKITAFVDNNTTTPGMQLYKASVFKSAGLYYINLSQYKNATDYLLKAIAIAEKNKFTEIQSRCLLGLSRLYIETGDMKNAMKYADESYLTAKKNNYTLGTVIALFTKSTILQDSDTIRNASSMSAAIAPKLEALSICQKLNDTASLLNCLNGLAESYADYLNYDTALYYSAKAQAYLTANTPLFNKMTTIFIKGKIHRNKAKAEGSQADDRLCIGYMQEALKLAEEMNNPEWISRCYNFMAFSNYRIGNYKEGFDQLNTYRNMHDSIVKASNMKDFVSIKGKYDVGKKDNEILQLNLNNNKKSSWLKVLGITLISLLLIGYLFWKNNSNKQKAAKQKIETLEKEKQLAAVDAILKGQEEERSRLAKDLHDGLGGMLSGVKLSFNNMKENMILDADNTLQFERSINQLDSTIAELRKVAHNLMPEALAKFGLKTAVEDFCSNLQQASGIKIIYQQTGEERELPGIANVNTYRIIQELVNNAIKHAGAKQILVQLTKAARNILISVEDDGKGFDANKQPVSAGMGLTNVKNRVQYHHGSMDVQSTPGKGTSVYIELNA